MKERLRELPNVCGDFRRVAIARRCRGQTTGSYNDSPVTGEVHDLFVGLFGKPVNVGKNQNLVRYANRIDGVGVNEIKIVKNYGQDKAKELDLSNPFNLLKFLSPPRLLIPVSLIFVS